MSYAPQPEPSPRPFRRKVFYIPGYDPFPPRRYRELYRSEGAAQAAELLLEVPQLRVVRPLELGLSRRVALAQHSSSPSLQIRGTVLARQSVEINVAGSVDFSDTIKSRIFFNIRTCFST